MKANTKNDLERRYAQLETINDQLSTELIYVNDLLISIGFPEGLKSVKEIAQEMLEEQKEEMEDEN